VSWPLALLKATRPEQWIKNVLVGAAPVAAGEIGDSGILARTAAATCIFIVASGAVYLVNDAADAEIDRAHPVKASRPIAAREISIPAALTAATTMATVAVVSGFVLALELGLVLAVYLAVNVAYSSGLKHVGWVELAVIASGFVLRAVAGGAATGLPLSPWFVAVISGGSLFIVTGKRTAELVRAGEGAGRVALGHYTIVSLRRLRVVAAATSVVAYAMWVVRTSDRVGWLALASLVLVAAAFARYSGVIESGRGEHPEDVFRHDRPFQLIAAAWLVVYTGAVYG
jgi:decaprenyl-phosphate phosphoribosyltransferase